MSSAHFANLLLSTHSVTQYSARHFFTRRHSYCSLLHSCHQTVLHVYANWSIM